MVRERLSGLRVSILHERLSVDCSVTVLFEGYEQEIGHHKHRKLNFNPLRMLAHQMNPIQGSFEKSKEELNLPPVGIQQYNLAGSEIKTACDQHKGCFKDGEGDESVDAMMRVIGKGDFAITDLMQECCPRLRHLHPQLCQHLIDMVAFAPNNEIGPGLTDVRKQVKADISSIADVGDPGFKHLKQHLSFGGSGGRREKLGRNHPIQFEGEVQFNGVDVFCIGGPPHGTDGRKHGAINEVEHAKRLDFRNFKKMKSFEQGVKKSVDRWTRNTG
jgi:hypothetical protein